MSDHADQNTNGPSLTSTASDRPARSPRSPEEAAKVAAFVTQAAQLMSDLHCQDVIIYDVRGISPVTDYIIIASGTSDRQIRSVADDVTQLGRQHDLEKFGRDEDGPSTWIAVDLIDVIVHLFEPNTRAHYDLEMMWGDAPQVQWKRAG